MDKILDKIRKLLRMKRGGTPAEVETALAMAAELARKHGIDLGTVDPDHEPSEQQRITHVDQVLSLRLPLEARFAAAILVNFFNVQVLVRRGACRWWIKKPNTVTFIGTAWDCEVAKYVFVFLQRHFRYSWSHRQNRRLKNRSAFLHGMFLGLAAKLEEQRDNQSLSENALVLIGRAVQLRKDYLANLCPEAKDMGLPEDDSEAWLSKMAGITEGKNTSINPGLNKSPDSVRLLLS